MLADGVITGAVIIAALFIGSWRIGAWAVGGAVVSTLLSGLAEHGFSETSTGLHTYSAVLVAIAIGAVFWQDRPLSMRLVGGNCVGHEHQPALHVHAPADFHLAVPVRDVAGAYCWWVCSCSGYQGRACGSRCRRVKWGYPAHCSFRWSQI